MKKTVLFIAVISAFSFASCKKDHVCTCITAGGSSQITTYPNSSKSAARAHCLSYNQSYNGGTYTTTCTLN